MSFSPEWLLQRLQAWPAPRRRYVALVSGGMDSMVLLQAMALVADHLPASVAVLHFNHGLNPRADAWQGHVERAARSLGLVFYAQRLDLETGAGGAEGRARVARYTRLRQWATPDDCCLTAHHAEDQAETVLLQALRGSGPAGLAAMPGRVRFGPAWLARPFLPLTRAELRDWANQKGLEWIEDPGNYDLASPRNWLRHRVWPHIERNWPAAARTLGRSAELAAEASALTNEVAAETLRDMRLKSADRLPVVGLRKFSVPRRRAVLRYWLRRTGAPAPTAEKLRELEREFVLRDPGARARLVLGEVDIRRFRGSIFAVRPLPPPPFRRKRLKVGRLVDLGRLGRIGLVADPHGPIGQRVVEGTLELRFRTGGERFYPVGCVHGRSLKRLFQERGVLPWLRFHLPLLYVNGQLASVADLVVAREFAGRGWRMDWRNAPSLE